MNAPKHTPGPWEVRIAGKDPRPCVFGHDGLPTALAAGVAVARCEREADARLIAAAPDLLAGAERALEILRSITDLPSDLAPFRETAAKMLNEAIARATGEP